MPRTRKEIEQVGIVASRDLSRTGDRMGLITGTILEVLLDIRDLLALHAPEESDYQRLMKYGGNGAGGGSAPEVKKGDEKDS